MNTSSLNVSREYEAKQASKHHKMDSHDPSFLSRHELRPIMVPRSEEAEWWYNAVYEAVQEIPYGRVTSYGHIAYLLGKRELRLSAERTLQLTVALQNSATCQASLSNWLHSAWLTVQFRQVGICLKHLPSFSPHTDHFFHGDNVPWHRVINSKGIISPR